MGPTKKVLEQTVRQQEHNRNYYNRRKEERRKARKWLREHPEEAAKLREEMGLPIGGK